MELKRYGIIFEDDIRNIFVFGSHQYALYYWTKAVWEKKLNTGTLLIHIDNHVDFSTPKCSFDNLVSPEEIEKNISQGRLHYDSFIRPAISMGIIQDIAFCCYPCTNNSVPNFTNYESPINIVGNLRKALGSESLSDMKKQLCRNIVARNLILDIDLDYFLTPNRLGFLVPKSDLEIKNEIAAINELHEYATITTIATSPNIGNNQMGYQRSIRELFCKSFAASIDLSKQPEIMNCE
ncbi:MAG: peptide arginase family protein [Thermodesulfovibrionales bacterium]